MTYRTTKTWCIANFKAIPNRQISNHQKLLDVATPETHNFLWNLHSTTKNLWLDQHSSWYVELEHVPILPTHKLWGDPNRAVISEAVGDNLTGLQVLTKKIWGGWRCQGTDRQIHHCRCRWAVFWHGFPTVVITCTADGTKSRRRPFPVLLTRLFSKNEPSVARLQKGVWTSESNPVFVVQFRTWSHRTLLLGVIVGVVLFDLECKQLIVRLL